MAGFNFSFNLLPPNVPASLTNTLGKGVPIPPAGQVFLTETIGGITYYLTESVSGVTYYLTGAA